MKLPKGIFAEKVPLSNAIELFSSFTTAPKRIVAHFSFILSSQMNTVYTYRREEERKKSENKNE